jgi:hypothetical protein
MQVKINIPDSLAEIKLHQYQRYMNVVDNSNDELFISQKTIEIFCDIDLKNTLNIAYKDVTEIMHHFKSVFDVKPELKRIISFNGKEYGFIPNLDDISLGELIDVSNSINDIQKLHIAMGVLYRPVKAKYKQLYEIEDYKADELVMEEMKRLTLDVVFGAMLFFYHLVNDLLKAIPMYLEEKVKEMTTHSKRNSVQSGDGIMQSINLLKEMLPDLTRLLDNKLTNV